MTEYRDVAGSPGYRVGDDGTVWSCRLRGPRGPRGHGNGPNLNGRWKLLRGTKKELGYIFVGIADKIFPVHRLVLDAFVGPRPEGMECRHLDGNPSNNALSNLCWGTPKENGEDAVAHGTSNRGSKSNTCKLTPEDVREIRRLCADGTMKISEIAKIKGVTWANVDAILKRRSWAWLDG